MADASFDEKIVPSDCKNNGLGRDKSQGYSEGGVFISFIYYEKNKIFNRYMKNTNLGCENCKINKNFIKKKGKKNAEFNHT